MIIFQGSDRENKDAVLPLPLPLFLVCALFDSDRTPYWFTVTEPRSVRPKQAMETLNAETNHEIEALQILTRAGCSSTPALFSRKQDKQRWESWVPGGYKVYILMEKLPGIVIGNFYHDME
jgi:hypothetical protein